MVKKQPKFSIGMEAKFNGTTRIQVQVKHNGKAYGTLDIRKGSVCWTKKNHQYGTRMGWAEFSRIMEGVVA